MRSFHRSVLLCCVGGLLCLPLISEAITYTEQDTTYNSHDLIGNAELLSYVSTDATALTTLNGTLGSSAGGLGEGDIYEIYISNPGAFSASTPVGGPNVNGFDTQLFLFNVNGTGIEANDDAVGGIGGASALTALATNYQPGFYYLLITGQSLNPAGGVNSAAVFPNDGSRVVTGPTDAGTVFSGYTDNSTEFGQYAINLTGVQVSPAPEPSSVALLVLAAGVAGWVVRRRRHLAGGVGLVLAAVCVLATTSHAADTLDTEAIRKQQLLAADGIPKNLGLGLGDLARDHARMVQQIEAHRASVLPETEAETEAKVTALTSKYANAQVDKKGRVLVCVYLDGVKPVKKMAAKLERKGLKVLSQLDTYRKGVVSAWLPVDLATKVAKMNGVRAVQMELKPYFRTVHQVGQVTSQGQTVLHADLVQDMGYDGTGIKIGALSDTFNLYTAGQDANGVPDNAQTDQIMGDLPTAGVQDISDFSIGVPTDEGRGMLQIAHDIAPGAGLAFATASGTQIEFAQNIMILGSPTTVTGLPGVNLSTGVATSPGIGCQVVCDDVGYLAEPMFSDGIVAQAIDYVATHYNVSYFSSAGNDGNAGYSADYVNAVTANRTLAAVKTIAASEGVNLDQTAAPVAASLYSGGVQSFGTDAATGNPIVVQNVTNGSIASSLVFQWDDPFDNSVEATAGVPTSDQITTDYNILVFDANGNYLSDYSGTADNFQTNQPIESPGTQLAANTSYKIMITRATDTDDPAVTSGGTPPNPPVSTHLRYVAASDGGGFSGDFIGIDSVETYGHNCAANCSGVAAYVYDAIPDVSPTAGTTFFTDPNHTPSPQVESFSSNGPVRIFFDSQGNRLTTPNVRLQPAFATVDGVDTSFFPAIPGVVILPGIIPISPPTVPTLPIDLPVSPVITTVNPEDYDGDKYSNFFGTSAAAPHAAACAALVMQAAAGNGLTTPNPKYIRSLFQATTQQTGSSPGTDTMPDFCSATGTGSGYTVTLAGAGDVSTDPNTFRITYANPAGGAYKLTSMFIDLTHSELVFDNDPTTGYPFTQGDAGKPETGGATLISAVESDPAHPVTTATNHLPAATLTFNNFAVGDQLTFGVDRDVQGINAYGNGVDQLEGSTFTATLTSGLSTVTVTGTFTNQFSTAYNFKAGYGLINVQAAVNRMLGR